MSTVNFYRLENAISFIPMYQMMLEEPIEFEGRYVRVSGEPGMGVEVSLEAMERYRAEGWGG